LGNCGEGISKGEAMIEINLPTPPGTRNPETREDWGDILTIGLCLRNKNSNIPLNDQFGIYMGLNKVGVKNFFTFMIEKEIQYNSAEEMHAVWELD
jgi:hypothetical protein